MTPMSRWRCGLGLLNLSADMRPRFKKDRLFAKLLASPLLVEAMLAASGAEQSVAEQSVAEQSVAALDQRVVARVPTIAGLLVVGRRVLQDLRDGQASDGEVRRVLIAPRPSSMSSRRRRWTLLDGAPSDVNQARSRLLDLTRDWRRVMREVSAASTLVAMATEALTQALVDDVDGGRFWEVVAHQAGVVAQLRDRWVYLRARPTPSGNVFVVVDPEGAGVSEVPVAQIGAWAAETEARVARDHLPRYLGDFGDAFDLGGGVTVEVTAADKTTGGMVLYVRPTTLVIQTWCSGNATTPRTAR